MDKVARSLPQKTMGGEICSHHWVIEFPSEPTSKGICKLCGCERKFVNSFNDLRDAAYRERKSKEKDVLAETGDDS
ncbi:hypothetical protein ACFLYR_07860, partial [Chloroflexota bacterium]